MAELEEARRLELVAEGKGIGVTVMHARRGTPGSSGIVFRPLDEDTPLLGYGVAWSATQASPSVESFVEVAREVAESEAASSMA